MDIIVRAFINKSWIDFSPYIVNSISTLNNYDTTFDRATINIRLKRNTIEGFDAKYIIEPGTPIYVHYKEKNETLYYTLELDSLTNRGRKDNNRIYIHNLSLIEPANELRFMKIPDMSFTQPVETFIMGGSGYRHLNYKDRVSTNSAYYLEQNDLDVITDNENADGLKLISGKRYSIRVTSKLINNHFNFTWDKPWWNFIDVISKIEIGNAFRYVTPRLGAYKSSSPSVLVTNIMNEIIELHSGSGLGVSTSENYILNNITANPDTWAESVIPNVQVLNRYFTYTPSEDVILKMDTGVNSPSGVYKYNVTARTYLPQVTDLAAERFDIDLEYDIQITEVNDGNILTGNLITLDRAIKKVLDNINNAHQLGSSPKYELDPEIISRINTVPITDMQMVGYTAWDALVKLSNEVEAVPYITGDRYNTVTLLFRDEQLEYGEVLNITSEGNVINQEDYTDGYSVDVNNIIGDINIHSYMIEPSNGLFNTVRADTDTATQITEDNAIFIFKNNIYHPHKFYLRGYDGTNGVRIRIKVGSTTHYVYGNTNTSNVLGDNHWDITSHCIEEKQYQALDNYGIYSDSERRSVSTKGNRIFYTKGDNKIKGLGYRPASRPGVIIDTPQTNPAVLEMLIQLAMLKLESEDHNILNMTFEGVDPDISLFDNIEAQIVYNNISNTNLNMMKYDAGEKLTDRIINTSSSDSQTSMNKMSKYLNTILNEKGNIEYIMSGFAKTETVIPDVGNNIVIDGNTYTVNTVETSYINRYKYYTMTLASNLINQNSNIGLNDEHRSWEIPDNNIVERIDKFNSYIRLMYDLSPIQWDDSDWTVRYLENDLSNKSGGMNILSRNSVPLFNTGDRTISNVLLTVKEDEFGLDNKYILPVNKYYIGTTMVFEYETIDNYQIGLGVDNFTIASARFKGNKAIRYTNRLGNVYEIDMKFMNNNIGSVIGTPPIPVGDYLPRVAGTWSNSDNTVLNYSYRPDKDSREKLKVQSNITYLSQNSKNTMIFPALAKYSPLLDMSSIIDQDNPGHNIGYGYLPNGTNINLTKYTLSSTLSELTWHDGLVGNNERRVEEVYARRLPSGEITKSTSSTDAEWKGIRIPLVAGSQNFVMFNRDTLEILFYHRVIPGETTDGNYSDLLFIPFRELPNYVDELRELTPININVDVRRVVNGIPESTTTTFNIDSYQTINNILSFPSQYTTNITSFILPSTYLIRDRASGNIINPSSVVYEDIEIDIEYDSMPKLLPPIVNNIDTNMCTYVYLTVTNPESTSVTIRISGVNYSFNANETKTITRAGYTNPGYYSFAFSTIKSGYETSNVIYRSGDIGDLCFLQF